MAVYQHLSAEFVTAPPAPAKTVETPMLVSYAYLLFILSMKVALYEHMDATAMVVNKASVIYQDMA